MSKYFDKDFFKFFVGFMAIVLTSLSVIIVTKIYQEQLVTQENSNTASVIKSILP